MFEFQHFGFLPLILALEFRHSLFSGRNCRIILPWFLDLSHQHSKLRPRRISHQLFRWYFGVLSLIDYNTWGMKKPYFFDVRPLLPCFVPTAKGKAEDDDENNINITLMSSQNCKMCSKYCCHATQRCLGWNTNMADKVGYHDVSAYALFGRRPNNKLRLWAALLKFWFQTDLGREYRQGKQLLLTFFAMLTRWSRSKSYFYALIA